MNVMDTPTPTGSVDVVENPIGKVNVSVIPIARVSMVDTPTGSLDVVEIPFGCVGVMKETTEPVSKFNEINTL